MNLQFKRSSVAVSVENYVCPNLHECLMIEKVNQAMTSGVSMEALGVSTEGLVTNLFKKLFEWIKSFFVTTEKKSVEIKKELKKSVETVKQVKNDVPKSEQYKARSKDEIALLQGFKSLPTIVTQMAKVQSNVLDTYVKVQDSFNLALVEKDTTESLKEIASKLKDAFPNGYLIPDGFLGECKKAKASMDTEGFKLDIETTESNLPAELTMPISDIYDFVLKYEREIDNVHTKVLEATGVIRDKFKTIQEKATRAEETEGRNVKSIKEQVSAHNVILKVLTTIVTSIEKYQRTLKRLIDNVNRITVQQMKRKG